MMTARRGEENGVRQDEYDVYYFNVHRKAMIRVKVLRTERSQTLAVYFGRRRRLNRIFAFYPLSLPHPISVSQRQPDSTAIAE